MEETAWRDGKWDKKRYDKVSEIRGTDISTDRSSVFDQLLPGYSISSYTIRMPIGVIGLVTCGSVEIVVIADAAYVLDPHIAWKKDRARGR